MNLRVLRLITLGFVLTVLSVACAAPQATPPPVNNLATNVAAGVSSAFTLTAEAPTSIPSATPLPTATFTPTSGPIQPPTVRHHAACWFGPGSDYNLESNITKGERVQILGVGSLPGWYIIRNPYFQQPCWIQAADLNIDPAMDLSQYPIVTPYPLRTPNP